MQYGKWSNGILTIDAIFYNHFEEYDKNKIKIRKLEEGDFNIEIEPGNDFRAGLYTLGINLTIFGRGIYTEKSILYGTIIANLDKNYYAGDIDSIVYNNSPIKNPVLLEDIRQKLRKTYKEILEKTLEVII